MPLKQTDQLTGEYGQLLMNHSIQSDDLKRFLMICSSVKSPFKKSEGYVNPDKSVTDSNYSQSDGMIDFVQTIGEELDPEQLHSLTNSMINITVAQTVEKNQFMRGNDIAKVFFAYEMFNYPENAKKHFESEQIKKVLISKKDFDNFEKTILGPVIFRFGSVSLSKDSATGATQNQEDLHSSPKVEREEKRKSTNPEEVNPCNTLNGVLNNQKETKDDPQHIETMNLDLKFSNTQTEYDLATQNQEDLHSNPKVEREEKRKSTNPEEVNPCNTLDGVLNNQKETKDDPQHIETMNLNLNSSNTMKEMETKSSDTETISSRRKSVFIGLLAATGLVIGAGIGVALVATGVFALFGVGVLGVVAAAATIGGGLALISGALGFGAAKLTESSVTIQASAEIDAQKAGDFQNSLRTFAKLGPPAPVIQQTTPGPQKKEQIDPAPNRDIAFTPPEPESVYYGA